MADFGKHPTHAVTVIPRAILIAACSHRVTIVAGELRCHLTRVSPARANGPANETPAKRAKLRTTEAAARIAAQVTTLRKRTRTRARFSSALPEADWVHCTYPALRCMHPQRRAVLGDLEPVLAKERGIRQP